MSLLLEKCEMATQSIDNPPSNSFNADIQLFVQEQLRQDKKLLVDDQEVNDLVGSVML